MKRTALVIVSVLALSFLTTSCLKDRVCKCTSLINPAMNENYIYEMSNKTIRPIAKTSSSMAD